MFKYLLIVIRSLGHKKKIKKIKKDHVYSVICLTSILLFVVIGIILIELVRSSL